MPFMVIYDTSDGTSCHEQADAIDEAALFVERLRNQDGIEQVRMYRMEEITFAFRPYYKVELGLPERLSIVPPSEVVGTATPAAARKPAAPPVPLEPAPAPVTVVEPEVVAVDEPAASTEPAVEVPAVAPEVGTADAAANGRRGLFGR